MTSNDESCRTCRYCYFREADVMECRRYAPPPLVTSSAKRQPFNVDWARVLPDDWCGEFVKADEPGL